jgi:hypothetical protein
VPNDQKLKSMLLSVMHKVPYVGHLGYQKTIFIVKKQYYWHSMKKEVVDFIARCLECQKVKVEHIHRAGLLQPLPISEWKWEVVTMDLLLSCLGQLSNTILLWWWWTRLLKLPILFQ